MWTRYAVRWDFTTRMWGSVPADPEIVKAWIEARKPRVRPPGGKSVEEIQEEVFDTIARGDEFDESGCNVLIFQRHAGLCCVRADTIRAHLKDCARVLSNQWVGNIQGERAFSTRIVNGLYHDPGQYWVPILRPDGTPVTKHDGEEDKAIHPRPGRSALKRLEWIQPARLDFTLLALGPNPDTASPAKVPVPGKPGRPAGTRVHKPSVSEADIRLCMTYGAVHGYGGERSAGEGRYTFTITREEAEHAG